MHRPRLPAGLDEGPRRRRLRPAPPGAARAGPRTRATRPRSALGAGGDRASSTSSCCGATSSCAPAQKQRDFWLGQLAALGRVNPLTYDDDETLRSLITVVPFGIPDDPPVRTRPAIKGVRPRHRPRRQGDPLGRRHLQLVRPPHPAARRRPAAPPPSRRPPVLPGPEAPQPRHPRDADGGGRPGAVRPSSGSPAPTCSSTRAGSTTTTARTTCSTPTSA